MPVAACLVLLTACQLAPELGLPSADTLKVGGDGEPGPPSAKPAASKQSSSKASKAPNTPCQKDFWGNCSQPTVALLPSLIAPAPPPPPAAQPPRSKGAKAPAGPCEKDFWGSCVQQPTPSLIPPSINLPSILAAPNPPPAGPPDKASDNHAQQCEKDFWGNCTQMIPTVHSVPSKPPPQEGQGAGPKAQCVRDFWGNCTPVATNRHAYRWRYVRPGHRNTLASTPTPPPPTGGGGGGRVESAGPSVVCHPKRRVIGEEQPTTEQAQLSAEQTWMGSVRHDFGERYQNLAMAKDVRYTCAPSSPKAGLKRAMYRCATEAVPCRTAGN
jgi:hypothetical protein